MSNFIEVCSTFLQNCYEIVNDYSSVISTGMKLYHSYTHDFKMLLQEIDHASFLLLEFNKLISRLESLQDRYKLNICSLSKAQIFSKQMYEFLQITGKDTGFISKVNERAYAKWYRDELKFYVDYLNNYAQFLLSDIDFIYQQVQKGNTSFAKQYLKCSDIYYK